MSDAVCKKIQDSQKETPSLSEKIGDALVSILGEPVEFYMLLLTETDKGEMLVGTAGMMEDKKMKVAPIYMIEALMRHASPEIKESFSRYREMHMSKKKH